MRRIFQVVTALSLSVFAACGGGGGGGGNQAAHPPPIQAKPQTVAAAQPRKAAEKIQLAGLVDRQHPVEPNTTFRPVVNGGIVSVNWADIQPDGPDTALVTTAIDQAVADAKAAGQKLKLKVYAGQNAPQWTMKQEFYADGKGGACLYDPPDTTNCIKVPRWWTGEFKQAYNEMWRKLGKKYDAEPTITDVQASRCTTLFAEPFLRQATDANNRTALVNKGFSVSADEACLHEMIDIHNEAFPTTKMDLAVHPYQRINDDKSYAGQDEAFSKSVMDYCRSVLVDRCVVGYNGLGKVPDLGSPEERMFADFAALGPPIWFQTASLDKLGGTCAAVVAALTTGVAYHSGSVELPAGYDNVCTVPELQPIDSQLEGFAT